MSKKINYELLLFESCMCDFKRQQKVVRDFKGSNLLTEQGRLIFDILKKSVENYDEFTYDNCVSYATSMTDDIETNNKYVAAVAQLGENLIGADKFDEYLEIVKKSVKQENLKNILKNVNIDINQGKIDEAIRKLSIEEIKASLNEGKEKTREEKLVDFMLDIDKNYSIDGENGVTTGIKLFDDSFGKLKRGELFVIGGSSGCVDSLTEYFNGFEWKPISEYTSEEKVLQFDTNTNEATLVKPLDYIKKPCDEMYHFKTKYGINQMLSQEHRVLYYNKNINNVKEKTAEEIYNIAKHSKFNGLIKTTFNYNGEGIDLTDNEIKIMCAVICDGSFWRKSPHSTLCRINLKKDRKKKELELLLKDYNYKARQKENGYTEYIFYAPRREKEFTPYWYNCSQHQLQIICDNVLKWDGSFCKGRTSFSTTIKSSADFIQFVFSSCGYRASIFSYNRVGKKYMSNNKEYARVSNEYTVSITKRNMCSLCGKDDIEKVKTNDGYKYCFTVPTHALVLRRNDRIFITGNSGKSLICNNMFAKWILEGKNVIYLSLEMGFNNLFARTASIIQSTNPKFYRGTFESREAIIMQSELNEKFVSKMNSLNNWDIVSVADLTNGKATIENVLSKCLLIKKERNWSQIDCIILDYLQFLDRTNSSDTEYDKVNNAVNKIKSFVIKEDVPFILITSLNAQGDIKGSTSILYTSDFSATVDFDARNKNIKHLNIIKSRYGTCGSCKVSYDDYLRVKEQSAD